jgi:hypothetical protein
MPNNNSWNGRWSGEDNYYGRTINFTKKYGKSKIALEKAKTILDERYFTYNFGDGWTAGIDVREVNSKEAAKLRKKSKGFCGYDWMIDSILNNHKIIVKEK